MTVALTDSIAGAVLNDLCIALRAMTVAGGYHWDVQPTSVQTDPENIVGIPIARRPFFLLEVDPNGQRAFEPANQLTVAMKLMVTTIGDAGAGTDPTRKTALGLALAMDIEKAVTVDITRGGRCSDTRVDEEPDILTALGSGTDVVVVQRLTCTVHRTYGAP